jgi:tRNA(His) guanylyltransferase
MNYNDIDPRFRKGSVLYREEVSALLSLHSYKLLIAHQIPQSEIEDPSTDKPPVSQAGDVDEAVAQADEASSTTVTDAGLTRIKTSKSKKKQRQPVMTIELQHCDIIKDGFWVQRRWILDR